MATKKLLFGIVALYVAYKFAGKSVTPGEVVETALGKVQGIESLSRDGREFYEWRGIPYAEPPVGALRYQTPRPAAKWAGVRDGSTFGPVCAQLHMFLFAPTGSEDCLHLNIASPKEKFHDAQNSKGLLPVMVYIHGGYFFGGSGSDYSASYFMDEDVVLVTINYRLGALGFLSTQDENARGNMGLKDQALALRWVKDNIGVFGGDPESITIFGESAGGASAHIQMLVPRNKGVVTRAISQSGTAISHWFHNKDPVGQARDYAKKLACPTENTKSLVECLKQKDVNDLLMAHMSQIAVSSRSKHDIFVPVVEAIKDNEALITKSAKDIYGSGEAPRTPWMTGVTSEEGLYVVADILRNQSNIQEALVNFQLIERGFLLAGDPLDPAFSAELRQFYLGTQDPVDLSKIQHQIGMAHACSDINFHVPGHDAIKLHASKSGPVFPYIFAKRGPSIVELLGNFKGENSPFMEFAMFLVKHLWSEFVVAKAEAPSAGAAHVDDLFMLFEVNGGIGRIGQNSIFYKFSKMMVRSWVQFASGKDMDFDGLKFPQVKSPEAVKYIMMNDTTVLTPFPNQERYNFWSGRTFG